MEPPEALAATTDLLAYLDRSPPSPWRDELMAVLRDLGATLEADLARGRVTGAALVPGAPRAEPDVSGWRCRVCHEGGVREASVECTAARLTVRRQVAAALTAGDLPSLADLDALAGTPRASRFRAAVGDATTSGGPPLCGPFLRPCPHCGSEETVVYRWLLVDSGGGPALLPAEGNPSLRPRPAESD